MAFHRSEAANWIALGGGLFLLSERGFSMEALLGILLIAYGIDALKRVLDKFF